MNKYVQLGVVFAVCAGVFLTPFAQAGRYMENLDRGLVAVSTGSGVYVGWRLLGTNPMSIGFNVYRNGSKLNSSPITNSTNYLDSTGTIGNTYSIVPVIGGVEQAASDPVTVWSNFYHTISLASISGSYMPNDACVGDLDGDGQYEIVLKRLSADISQTSTTFHLIEAYRLDGTLLWRINLGPNNLYAPEEINPMVYDFDSDGRAEVALRTCEGNVDGIGNTIGDTDGDGKTDYRDSIATPGSGWYMTEGPEFLSIFDGLTGEEIARTDYIERDPISQWGLPGMTLGMYAHRADKCMMTPAYLDGQRPSLVICRGIYHRIKMEAWNFRDGSLSKVWSFDSYSSGYSGQGNHNLTVGDVDNDGKDEIVYASTCVDDDGSGLYTTRLGHGDALHMSDMDPSRPGLEVFAVHENANGTTIPVMSFRDAATGEVIWRKEGAFDCGRGVSFDIDPRYPGNECWGSNGEGLYDVHGNLFTPDYPTGIGGAPTYNFGIWWDGDLLRELLDRDLIMKWVQWSETWNTSRLLNFLDYGGVLNNGTKYNPCLVGDILGDWREELLVEHWDGNSLILFTTTDVTAYRIYTLMHDPQYRLAIAWQCNMYNQPPHPGFYIGADMANPPTPDIILTGYDPDETDPPTPDPMKWGFVPHVSGNGSIAMHATEAIDPSGVEYYFECTSGNGHDSGWQDSPFYKDTGLSEGVAYTYTVTVRDKSNNQNTTEASTPASCVVESMPGYVFWDFEDGGEDVALSSMPEGGSEDTISGIIIYGSDSTNGPSFSDKTPPGSGLSIHCNGSQDGFTQDVSLNSWSPQVWTIECSVRLDDDSGWRTLIGRDGASGTDPESDFYLQKNDENGAFRLNILTVGGARHILDADFVVQTHRWYRLAVTSDGVTLNMYCDKLDGAGYQLVGSMDISAQSVSDNALKATNYNWTFGRGWYDGTFTDHIIGYLDNVRFTEAVLMPEEFLDVAPPVFTSNPIVNNNGTELKPYTGQSLVSYATDPDFNPLTFSKVFGPAWLVVSPDGTLSGIPMDSDTGSNVFTVRVTDSGGLFDTATMTIDVSNTYSGTKGLSDLLGLVQQWLTFDCGTCNGADLDGDNDVTLADFWRQAHNWLGDESLQVYLKFDETSGTTASDSSIYQRSGQLVNTPSWDPSGMVNGALSFNGTDDYVEVTGYKGITGNASRTCSVWVKVNNSQANGVILSWGNTDNGGKWIVRVNSGGQLRVEVQGGNIIGSTIINDGAWHHIAVVLDDDGSPDIIEAELYVDGNLETISASADEPVSTASQQDVAIGTCTLGSYTYFDGLIDDVRIYDRVLSGTEISDLYQGINP